MARFDDPKDHWTHAPGGVDTGAGERLRTVRGILEGAGSLYIRAGVGFTLELVEDGDHEVYVISFAEPFSSEPTITLSTETGRPPPFRSTAEALSVRPLMHRFGDEGSIHFTAQGPA